jgi:hypothetical protein
MLGVSGGLISESYAHLELPALLGEAESTADSLLLHVLASMAHLLGPASGVCTIADVAAIPML